MRRLTFPLYAGGFLGPFGGTMIVALVPNIADGLDASLTLVAVAITAYTVPFATLQLASGTIAERLGPRRVVRSAYLVYAAASLVCAFAPEIWTLVAGRAVQGASNAFLTPVLLAALSEIVPAERLGRSVGTFAGIQTAGITLAPVIGGALGEVSWRLGFVVVGAAALALALAPQAFDRVERRQGAGSLRSLLDPWLGLASAMATLGYLGFSSMGLVVVLVAADDFSLGSAARGLVVGAYGVGGFLFGTYSGVVADRVGRPATTLGGIVACAAGVFVLGFAPSAWALALVYFAIGCASAFVWAGMNTMVLECFRANRAGALSAYNAFKFGGTAIAPVVYLPLYGVDHHAPFLLAGAFSVVMAALAVPWFARYRRPPSLAYDAE